MIATRCQVCGRRKPTRQDGRIVHHHFKGQLCRGAEALPYDQDDSALRAAARHWEALTRTYVERQLDHHRRRLNEPLEPWFFAAMAAASSEATRLSGRLYRRTYYWKPAT